MTTAFKVQTKTEKAKELFISGDVAGSLAIIKTFKQGFTKDEKRTLEIAHECQIGHEGFYKNIGIDTDAIWSKAKRIIKNKYGI